MAISLTLNNSFTFNRHILIALISEQNLSWMRPLLRCHLEIPKNCQISHGTSFNRNLTAVTRWKTEFLCRRPTEGAGRGSEPWHCHLIDPPPLNCTVQPAHPRVIWLSRKGREVDHEESGVSSADFLQVFRLFWSGQKSCSTPSGGG